MMNNNNGVNFLPPGFRFNPKDSEILMDYLFNKVKGLKLPCDYAITDCDLYDGKDKWKEMFTDRMPFNSGFYFFTKLKKKTGKGLRINRFTGSGTWKETQKDRSIYCRLRQQDIGTKKSFKFVPATKNESPDNLKFRWLMDEYRLDSHYLDDNADEYVVCHIKREKEIVKHKSCPVKATISNVESLTVENVVSPTVANVVSPTDMNSPTDINLSAGWTNEELEDYYIMCVANQPTPIEEENGGRSFGSVVDSNNVPFNSSSGIYLEEMEAYLAENNNDQELVYNPTVDGTDSNLWTTVEELESLLMLPAN